MRTHSVDRSHREGDIAGYYRVRSDAEAGAGSTEIGNPFEQRMSQVGEAREVI